MHKSYIEGKSIPSILFYKKNATTLTNLSSVALHVAM